VGPPPPPPPAPPAPPYNYGYGYPQSAPQSPAQKEGGFKWHVLWLCLSIWGGIWAIVWLASTIYYNTGWRAAAVQAQIGNYSTYSGESIIMLIISIGWVIGFAIGTFFAWPRKIRQVAAQ
jgi:hypothetical protein